MHRSSSRATTLALAGSRCRTCATVAFPRQSSCSRCAGVDVEPHALPTEGTIWAFTEQLFPPKPPYAVQGARASARTTSVTSTSAGEVIVESRIVATAGSLRIGQPVRLVTEAFTPAGDVVTYAFTPDEETTR